VTGNGTSTVGELVTLTATVSPTLTGGTVQFHDNTTATDIGTAQSVIGGIATVGTPDLTVGTHSITAHFSGTTGYASSDSPAVTQIVNAARTAYEEWSDQITNGKGGATQDADDDGAKNLAEFAFNGNPNSGADQGRIYSFERDFGGAKAMVLTVAVLKTTDAFTSADSPVGTNAAAGITYTIQGSNDLSFPNVKVVPLSPAVVFPPTSPPYMPDLDATDYEYRSFKLDGSEGLPTKGFLRAMVTQP